MDETSGEVLHIIKEELLNQNLEKFHESIMFDKGVERYDRRYLEAEAKGHATSVEMAAVKEVFENSFKAIAAHAEKVDPYCTKRQWQSDIEMVGAENCTHRAYSRILTTPSLKSGKPLSRVKLANEIGEDLLSLIIPRNSRDEKKDMNRIIRLGEEIITALLAMPNSFFREVSPEQIGMHKTQHAIEYSDFATSRLQEIYEYQRFASPMFSPMVVPPRSILEGCYYDERLAIRMPLCNTRNSYQSAKVRESAVLGAKWLKAVDFIQSVGLKLNTEMLAIVNKAYQLNTLNVDPDNGARSRVFPKLPPSVLPKGLEKREINQYKSLQGTFMAEFKEAREFAKEEVIYLPAYIDFRGRVYAKPKLNHQAVDWMKSLWLFAEGKSIDTPEAAKWLKVHLANCGDFNKISKASFDDRVKWVDDNHNRIMKYALDPFEDTEWLYEASEPFCFTAACIEYRKWQLQGSSYICNLPVAVDGSNSGLQHFSAMARDLFTGSAVNLVPMDKPQDVYQVAADYLLEILEAEKEDPLAKEWLDFGISRKTTKRATMTICYGSRKGGLTKDKKTGKMKSFGWTEQLLDDIIDGYEHKFTNSMKSATYLANHLDTVLRKIAPKPMEVMDWLQKVSGVMSKFNLSPQWFTPMNFPAVSAYYKPKDATLDIEIKGKRKQMKYRYGFTEDLIQSKQKNGISPNFVHSCDAAHLQMTALNAKEAGINSVLMIHDSFSCLPTDMEQFHKITTESFVDMYEHWDAINEFYLTAIRGVGVENAHLIPPPPEMGELDLSVTRDSKYAFA